MRRTKRSSAGIPAPPSASRAVLAYNLGRLLLLAVCLGLGWVAGLRGLWLIIAALFVSGLLSWFLLARQRIGMGAAVERTVERSRVRFEQHKTAEDDYVDSLLAEEPVEPTS